MPQLAPASPKPEILLPTGKSYGFGRFTLRLNIPWDGFKDSGESFYLLAHPKAFAAPVEGYAVDLNSYGDLPPENWAVPDDRPPPYLGTPIKLVLTWRKAMDGDYPEASVFSWALSQKWNDGYRYSLAFARMNDPGRGLIVFRNLTLDEVSRWSREAWESAGEEKSKRFIHVTGPWQPEKPWKKDGAAYLWRLPNPLLYIDGHLHIQSHYCAPLPLVWDKIPVAGGLFKFLRVGWESKHTDLAEKELKGVVHDLIRLNPGAAFAVGGLLLAQLRLGYVKVGLETVTALAFGESGEIGLRSTFEVGKILARELESLPDWDLPFYGGKESVFPLATPLSMDMHYGHFRGYFGEPIYQMENGVFTFDLNPFSREKGKISDYDTKKYEPFEDQITYTKNSAKARPWRLLPLYHYDPRRWRDEGKTGKAWDEPFEYVHTTSMPAKSPWNFIGFKTYTSLGYMPLDPLLPWQKKFYARCEKDGIPVMNHCSTAGIYTHDKPYFYDLWKRDPALRSIMRKSKTLKDEKTLESESIEVLESELQAHLNQGIPVVDFQWMQLETRLWMEKVRWFDEHYVFPGAWEKVIDEFPRLKLCLAHLCGFEYWGDKKKPNGFRDPETGLLFGFPETKAGQLPDAKKTNPLIHQLCKLMRKDNQVHADLSFFFFTEYNRDALRNFFAWARAHEGGFILDRLLWGTDWPLPVTDLGHGGQLRSEMMKRQVSANAKALCEFDPELWLRMTLVNPARFYNLKGLLPHLEKAFGPRPSALRNIPKSLEELYTARKKVME